jgi:hypothetical protein
VTRTTRKAGAETRRALDLGPRTGWIRTTAPAAGLAIPEPRTGTGAPGVAAPAGAGGFWARRGAWPSAGRDREGEI